MTIKQFAADALKSHKFKVCYIAVMPNQHYDLEIEIPDYCIAGVFRTDYKVGAQLDQARALAAELDKILTARGVRVYRTREEWEASQEEE